MSDVGALLFDQFLQLRAQCSHGLQPLRYADILACSEMLQWHLRPEEFRAILAADRIFVSECRREEAERREREEEAARKRRGGQ